MSSSINANQLFPVTAVVLNTGTNGLTLAGNFLTKNAVMPVGTNQSVLSFGSAEEVSDFFGATSVEYLNVAIPYFLGYDNSFNKPGNILFSVYVDAIKAAGIFGNAVTATVAQFAAISSGTITFNINGSAKTISSISLTGLTSFSAIATALQVAFRAGGSPLAACTIVYDSAHNRFVFSTGLTTGTDTILSCTAGTLAGYLGFVITASTDLVAIDGVGYLTQGSPILATSANLDNILALTLNFASFSNIFDTSADTAFVFNLAASSWANDNGYSFYVYNTIGATETLALNTAIEATSDANVVVAYATLDIVAASMGFGACINYNRANSVIGWAFKSQSGLTPMVTSDSVATALVDAKVNFYGKYSNASNSFNFYQQGRIKGQFAFIQNFYNQMWLSSELQNALLSLFAISPIVDYSAQGYSSIQAAITGVLQRGLNNRVITKGNTFSAAQKAILTQQAGYDISGDLTNNGYYIKMEAVDGDQRADNVPPPTTIWYTNGGIILTLPITTVYVR